ncbi:carboxypeptidase-like regulatory domain-containing protein [Cystobacter fuscus]
MTDANDGLPISGATVRALEGNQEVRTVTTGADGHYRMLLFLGTYTLEPPRRTTSPRRTW